MGASWGNNCWNMHSDFSFHKSKRILFSQKINVSFCFKKTRKKSDFSALTCFFLELSYSQFRCSGRSVDRTQSCEDCNPGSTPGRGKLINGRLAERSKAHVWSTCIRATVSRVRIPNLPKLKNGNQLSFFLFFLRMLKYERFFYFFKDKHEKRTKNLKFTDDNSPHRSWIFLLMAANPTSRDHYHPSQRC